MQRVTVRLPVEGFSAGMISMREWLDRNGCETRGFDCVQSGDEVVLSVGFLLSEPAAAFAKVFDGDDNAHPPFLPSLPQAAAWHHAEVGAHPPSQSRSKYRLR